MDLARGDWVALLTTGIGAFLGAAFAFALEALRRRADERGRRHSALLEAQFALSMQLNTLVVIRNQYLNPHRHDPERVLKLVPIQVQSHDLFVDMNRIAFVASEDQVEGLQRVHTAQFAYVNAIGLLRERNQKFERVCYSPEIEATSFDFESGQSTSVLDSRRVRELEAMTNGVYESTDDAIDLLQEATSELAAASKRMYPKKKVLSFEFSAPDQSG